MLIELPRGPLTVTPTLEICHGAPFDEDYYVFDADDARRALEVATAPICLYGHTHLPALFATADHPRQDRAGLEPDWDSSRATGAYPRVGRSLTQPRDGDPLSSLPGSSTSIGSSSACGAFAYDIAGAQAAILAAGLPAVLA